MGEMRRNVLVVKSEVKKPFGRPMSRMEDNIRMELTETSWKGVDRMHVTQDRDK
jgi:hypothetical protein